ncbi:hypothetical protein FGO68_gene16689 [Halteria grandinella]|uniref:Uncharacterized protein n=1 Tax=Halteria grandinella TaxID=5974 RepID=A0A8J8NL65_HALGN|nr:hypothetical protein FGO68_gene16689 [Halteria grandinella]
MKRHRKFKEYLNIAQTSLIQQSTACIKATRNQSIVFQESKRAESRDREAQIGKQRGQGTAARNLRTLLKGQEQILAFPY